MVAAAGRKAVSAARRPCAVLGIKILVVQCLFEFDTLAFSHLNYVCEVWVVSSTAGEAAKGLHRGFVKQLLGVRKSRTSKVAPAEFGRFHSRSFFGNIFCDIATE